MRTNLIAAAVALAVALLPSAALAEKTRLTAVSGPVSGGWYLGVGLVAKAFTDANPNYEVTMLPGNSTSNVIQLQQKKADLSIGMHTMNMAAIKGTAPYKKAFPNIAAYANLNDTARFHFVVTKKSGITSIAQLRDSKMPVRLAYGAVGGSGEVFCGWIFESYGFTYKDIQSWGGKLYSNNLDDIVNMTKDGQLDAIVWVGPGESWFFTEIAQNVDLVWLPVDEKIMDDVAKKHGLGKGTIPGSLFKGMVGKDIPTVTECNELTVRADLDEETVYRLTKAFIENLDDSRKGCATWADCTPEKAAKDTGAPMHPGAGRYYKEAGLLK